MPSDPFVPNWIIDRGRSRISESVNVSVGNVVFLLYFFKILVGLSTNTNFHDLYSISTNYLKLLYMIYIILVYIYTTYYYHGGRFMIYN